MSWSLVTVGGVPLRESQTAEADDVTVSLSGRELSHITTAVDVQAAHFNVSQMAGLTVPVVFEDKSSLTGFYRVDASSSRLRSIADGDLRIAEWSATLNRLGAGRDVEIQSRVPLLARTTDHAVTPVFWHAPAAGFTSYYTGTSNPSGSVDRASADGPVTVQLGVPAGVTPRWTVSAADYLRGGARLLLDGIRRVGTFTPQHTSWQVDNGLVRFSGAAGGVFEVACWDSGAWASVKGWRLTIGGSPVTTTPEVTVLRNDPEEVIVRLSYPTTPSGRVTADLGLRRGSRFVTAVVKRHTAATLGLQLVNPEAGAAETGRLRGNNDAAGNRYVVGSAKTYTADTVNGGISKPAVTTLDAFIGHAFNGSAAVAGDTPGDLLAQYLAAAASERATVVRR